MNGDPQRSDIEDPAALAGDRGSSRRSFLTNTAILGGAVALSASDLGIDVAEADARHDRATIEFQNQETGGERVVVDSVLLSLGGFVAIHDARLLGGQAVESVIGVSERLPPGEHDDVVVDLFDVPGTEFENTQLTASQPLIAMPHFDANDNGEYDFVASGGEKDGPYLRSGQPVIDSGFAVLAVETDFRNQESDGSTVMVNSVIVPDGGFVAIHDDRLFQGQPLESVIGVSDYLQPGRHESLTIDLFTGVPGGDFDQQQLTGMQLLVAMPHRDTNGNQEYDFVATDGSADGPYTVAGQAVIDTGFVEVN